MESNSATLASVLQLSLPLGSTLVAGTHETNITWAVMVRAQPPAFPDLSGGELALVSMALLRVYDSRITLAGAIEALADAGVHAVATLDDIPQSAVQAASEKRVALVALPEDSNLARVERAVNALIVNQKAQMEQRANDIQRQLVRVAAENRDLNSLLQIMARATGKSIAVHDDAGVTMAQVYPHVARRLPLQPSARGAPSLPYAQFQSWLSKEAPTTEGIIVASPLGFTTVLKVEKRVAGYLTLVDGRETLEDFDRLVLSYGADICAIEMAKHRAIAFAVEQTRGDWVQLWLSGTPADDDMILARAQQVGFEPGASYQVAVFRALTESSSSMSLEGMLGLVRDDLSRRQITGAVGYYVDTIVVLYPLDGAPKALERVRAAITELRSLLAARAPGVRVACGISRPTAGLSALREAYREGRDALSIANELGESEHCTYFGDLKLYQFLLALKERNLDVMRRFHSDTLGVLVEHDGRKQADLVRTLEGFFAQKGNLAKAATALDVHRNTLVYRLERITELTGFDLNDEENRLILHLALKIGRVLATLPEL
jgi:purine catabolism regulator